jgi:hypothetical protein
MPGNRLGSLAAAMIKAGRVFSPLSSAFAPEPIGLSLA